MRASGRGPEWIRRCATVITRALDLARKRGLIDANPSKDAVRPKSERQPPCQDAGRSAARHPTSPGQGEVPGSRPVRSRLPAPAPGASPRSRRAQSPARPGARSPRRCSPAAPRPSIRCWAPPPAAARLTPSPRSLVERRPRPAAGSRWRSRPGHGCRGVAGVHVGAVVGDKPTAREKFRSAQWAEWRSTAVSRFVPRPKGRGRRHCGRSREVAIGDQATGGGRGSGWSHPIGWLRLRSGDSRFFFFAMTASVMSRSMRRCRVRRCRVGSEPYPPAPLDVVKAYVENEQSTNRPAGRPRRR